MNRLLFRPVCTQRRRGRLRGVSLVELLVVLGIIALLLAMILSGVQAARDAYKRLERLVGQITTVDQQGSPACPHPCSVVLDTAT